MRLIGVWAVEALVVINTVLMTVLAGLGGVLILQKIAVMV
jgi:hypothetical protein